MFVSGRVSVLGVFASLGFSVATPGLGRLDVEDDDIRREVLVVVGGDREVNEEVVVSRKSEIMNKGSFLSENGLILHIFCANSSSSVIPFFQFFEYSLFLLQLFECRGKGDPLHSSNGFSRVRNFRNVAVYLGDMGSISSPGCLQAG